MRMIPPTSGIRPKRMCGHDFPESCSRRMNSGRLKKIPASCSKPWNPVEMSDDLYTPVTGLRTPRERDLHDERHRERDDDGERENHQYSLREDLPR
jgi:hypothetical protein